MQITKRKLSRRRRVVQKRTKRLGRKTRKGRSTRRRAGQRGGECPDCSCCREDPFGNSAKESVLVGFDINLRLGEDDEVKGGDFGRYEQIRDNLPHDMPQEEVARIGRVVKKACDRGCPHQYKKTGMFNTKCRICHGTKKQHDLWQQMGAEIREGNDPIWKHHGVFGPHSVSPEDFYTDEDRKARRERDLRHTDIENLGSP